MCALGVVFRRLRVTFFDTILGLRGPLSETGVFLKCFTTMFSTTVYIPFKTMKHSASCERAVCAVFQVSVWGFTPKSHLAWSVCIIWHENFERKTARFVPNVVWPGCDIPMTWLKHCCSKQRLAVFGHVRWVKLKNPTHTSATKHHRQQLVHLHISLMGRTREPTFRVCAFRTRLPGSLVWCTNDNKLHYL